MNPNGALGLSAVIIPGVRVTVNGHGTGSSHHSPWQWNGEWRGLSNMMTIQGFIMFAPRGKRNKEGEVNIFYLGHGNPNDGYIHGESWHFVGPSVDKPVAFFDTWQRAKDYLSFLDTTAPPGTGKDRQ